MSKTIILDFTNKHLSAIRDIVDIAQRYSRGPIGQQWHELGHIVSGFLDPRELILDKRGRPARDPISIGAATHRVADGSLVHRYAVAARSRYALRLLRKFARFSLDMLENPQLISNTRFEFKEAAEFKKGRAGLGWEQTVAEADAAVEAADRHILNRRIAMAALIGALDNVIGRKPKVADEEPEPAHAPDADEPIGGPTL